jgi:divalent metal cation (Fe/Co/Zn/Cd) transporter
VKRLRPFLSAVLVLVGVFWTGRESGHGIGALWEHWWCPLPLVAIVVGALVAGSAVFGARRSSSNPETG